MSSQEEGIITGLFLCEEKGHKPVPSEELCFLAGAGIKGDIHATGGSRQVSMLSAEAAGWMEEQEVSGLCFKRYKANLVTKGLSFSGLMPGTCIQAGTAVLTVSESPKDCFQECVLFRAGEPCRLSSCCVFLKVERTGNIRKNDKIVIIA